MLFYDDALKKSLAELYGSDLTRVLQILMMPSRRYYLRVNTLRTSSEAVIERLQNRGIEVYRDEELSEAIYIPVKGLYRVEPRDKVVVVDKYAAEAVYMGSHLYAPGIIRCSDNVKKNDIVSIVAENGSIVAEGRVVLDCKEALTKRRGLAVYVTVSTYKIPPIRELPEYLEGLIYPQSLPAIYVARILSSEPNELVVDICAAPGGKTGHIVELSRGKAYVIAFDYSKARLDLMTKELDRLGHTPFVEIWRADSRYLHIDFSWIRADKVIVDPPCTSLGVRPKLYDTKHYYDVINAAKYQIQFLRSAIKILRKGGVLVYSTCTITIEENENVVDRFIEEEKCVEPIPIDISRGSRGFKKSRYGDLYLRFHPHEHDTPGYFIAKLIKKC